MMSASQRLANIDFGKYLKLLEPASPVRVRGRVMEMTGLVVEASVPGVRTGDAVDIIKHHNAVPLVAEVVGFRDDRVLLMPLGELEGIGPDSEVIPHGKPLSVKVGPKILGRVLDGVGNPLDSEEKGELEWEREWPIMQSPPDPLKRRPVDRPFKVGIRAFDGCITVGEGQRLGFFAGAGVGKTTLMGMIARNCEADIVVTALIGERGREVLEFIHDAIGDSMHKSVVVVATSDRPSLVRKKAAYTATAVAEYFRDVHGKKVLLMMDSVTRFARAQREIGLAIGEPPARQGYTPSVFSELPKMLERSGNGAVGSITAFYTILAPAGDMSDPVAEEVKSILDGHVVLDEQLGARNHWPAIAVTKSLSRVMANIVPQEHKKANGQLRQILATYEKQRDLILIGAYERGSDPKVDYAIDKIDEVEAFLKQRTEENPDYDETVEQLKNLFSDME
jgi:ATP synthase in type III secretion protein N